MNKTSLIARYLLALLLLVFGLNKFLGFMPPPEYAPDSAQATYMIGLSGTQLFPVLGILYIATGILFATNKMVGLATMIVAPIAFNILLFHIVLDPANLAPGIVLTVLLVLVMIGNKAKYQALFS